MEQQFSTRIITVDSPSKEVLFQQTQDIPTSQLPLAKEIAEKLFSALQPHFPAAGLAAPQIGISKSLFIYSYDRDPANLETAINPSFTPLTTEQAEGWEACLSILLSQDVWKIAKIPRYLKIKANYLNLNGEKIEKNLEGFAAKVFQHEYDHLQGIVNIYRSDATVKTFDTKNELLSYMQEVKKVDSCHYIKPYA